MKPLAILASFFVLYLLPCRTAGAAEPRPTRTLEQAPAPHSPAPAKAHQAPQPALANAPPAVSAPRPRYARKLLPSPSRRSGARARLFRSGLSPPA